MRHMLLNTSEAAAAMRDGQVVAYPTEAVYGLGCDPRNEKAVRTILSLKHRPASAGLILIGASFTQFRPWVAEVAGAQLERAMLSWPGPVTWLFPKREDVPEFISGEHETIAIRVTAHQPSIELCEAFGGPLVSTSANPHGSPPATSSGEVESYFGPYLGGILSGPLGGGTATSEIRDLATGNIIRAGS
jgi:L-threonylcarbamoyladenylate synthase